MEYINQIITGDARELAKELPDDSVDLVVTSPPYNVGINYDGTDDNLTPALYRKFAGEIMDALWKPVKKGGRVCVEIGGSGRNLPLSWAWQDAAYKTGFGLYSEITLEHRKTNPTAWGSWLKADNVYTIPNFHMLYIFYKESERKEGVETNISKQEFVEWTRGRWNINFSANGGNKNHPASYPVSLPRRCILLFGHVGDVVLDPFMGSGTTAVACIYEKRNFIGFEKSEQYAEDARKRIAGTNPPLFTIEANLEGLPLFEAAP